MRKLVVLATAFAVAVGLAVPAVLASGSSVGVSLKEFKVIPTAASVKAGKVTFKVKNVGLVDHEFVVVKKNAAPGKLPVKGGRAVVKALGRIGPFKKGTGGSLTVTLAAGKYVLLCNVAGHYQAGQYARFTVR